VLFRSRMSSPWEANVASSTTVRLTIKSVHVITATPAIRYLGHSYHELPTQLLHQLKLQLDYSYRELPVRRVQRYMLVRRLRRLLLTHRYQEASRSQRRAYAHVGQPAD